MKISDRTVYLLMILTALFWAGAFVGGKIAVAENYILDLGDLAVCAGA